MHRSLTAGEERTEQLFGLSVATDGCSGTQIVCLSEVVVVVVGVGSCCGAVGALRLERPGARANYGVTNKTNEIKKKELFNFKLELQLCRQDVFVCGCIDPNELKTHTLNIVRPEAER